MKKEILNTINYFEYNNLDLLIAYDDVYKIVMVNLYEKNFDENYAKQDHHCKIKKPLVIFHW